MRGMKKWLPFKSLNGQYQILAERKEQKNKVNRPELSLDQIDDLNYALTSLEKGDKAKVTFYQSGSILTKNLTFLKCDGYQQKALFKEFSLLFRDLIQIKKINLR